MLQIPRTLGIALLVASLLFPATVGQTYAQETRARRAENPKPDNTEWRSQPDSVAKKAIETGGLMRLESEPVMRIALATEARSVAISTAGHLMNASELNSPPVPLQTSRVRIESRVLSPLRANDRTYKIDLAQGVTRERAEGLAKLVRDETGEDPQVTKDKDSDKWQVSITKRSRADAEAVHAKLEDEGFDATVVEQSAPGSRPRATPEKAKADPPAATASAKTTDARTVRPAARSSVPTRELVAFAHGSAHLLRSSAPITFASDDETHAPVHLNDKPYRGRLEVFASPRGTMTVVNVIGLEDYVRGVVPNELSPGGYPAIEALKAQAIAARTYAVRNRGQFAAEGFDLLPTTRSQVYRGLTSEHPLSSRAVDETRGIIATYNGEPINALYTSTCGGRTEDSEKIFLQAVPYLRGRECGPEGKAALAPFTIKSSRELFEIKEEQNVGLARDVALLAINGFALPSKPDRVSDSWLASHVSLSEVREWLGVAARHARTGTFTLSVEAARSPGFSTALVAAIFGDHRADTLLNNADVDYLLAFRDAEQIPAANRPDVALLLRDGYLSLHADATLRPREPMSRAQALHAIARLLEARGLLALQKGTARPSAGGVFILRSTKGKDQPIVVSRDAFLFRQFGENAYQMRSLALVGGEPATFHVNAHGAVDYLEVRPAPNGASAERFSPYTNWTSELSRGEVQARLARSIHGIGSITDLRVAARGSSRRVTDLEVIGASGTAHIRGGRIRSALGLHEQLFVVDRLYDANRRISAFVFTGRGWGHGVGMCQVGAYGLARLGWTYEQILKAYYTGIELRKLY